MGLFSRTADVPALVSKRDVEGLVKALRDDDTRDQAAEAIVELEDPAAVRHLEKLAAKLLTGGSSNEVALETLHGLGPDTALAPLLELCAEGSPVAARVVAGFGEDVALAPLIQMREHETRRAAAVAYRGLLDLGTEKAMAAVVEGLERGPNQVEALREALRSGYVGWQGAEPEVIRASFAPLRIEPYEDSEEARLADKILRNTAKRVRENAIGSDEPIAAFVEMLSDSADHVRMAAAMMLSQSLPEEGLDQPDPRMADALDRTCRDEFDGARVMAAEALRKQGDPRALGHLMALLDERDEIAIQAMISIRSLAEQSGLPDDEGKLIVGRYEEEGTRSKLQPNLAVVAGLVKQKARRERKAAERNQTPQP